MSTTKRDRTRITISPVAIAAGHSPQLPQREKPSAAPKPSIAVPLGLIDAALIDAEKCAAAGDVSVSWWLAEVAAGRAPQPVVRMTRLTRWSLQAVRQFWLDFAKPPDSDTEVIAASTAKAIKASAAAKLNRDAAKALALSVSAPARREASIELPAPAQTPARAKRRAVKTAVGAV